MIRILVIITLLAGGNAGAAETNEERFKAGIAEFTAAYQDWDSTRFGAAADLFRPTTTNASASVTNFYWLGAAHFHRMLALKHGPGSATNQAQVPVALEAALDTLTAGLKLDEHHAESRALVGTIYGMKINDSFLRAAWYGPKVMKNRDLALAAGPKNPRVRYLLGMCEFHTASKPTAWRQALHTLLAAEKLFAEEASRANSPLEPRWGHSSCLTFIGQTYELLGETAKAADYFRQALAEHPADHLARAGLARVTRSEINHP